MADGAKTRGDSEIFDAKAPLSCISKSPDAHVYVIGGRDALKIVERIGGEIKETLNLRSGKRATLDITAVDAHWHPFHASQIATAAVNSHVVVWDLLSAEKKKFVLTEHKRQVQRVQWKGRDEPSCLMTAGQDGCILLWDMRAGKSVMNLKVGQTTIRDVRFNMHHTFQIASGNDAGEIKLWDMRASKTSGTSSPISAPVAQWSAHSGPVLSLDWNASLRGLLASGGRDRKVKVWDANQVGRHMKDVWTIQTTAAVANICWRPKYRTHIAVAAVASPAGGDREVSIWDVTRPYYPIALLQGHTDCVTGFVWESETNRSAGVVSCSNDNTMRRQPLSGASFPFEDMRNVALAWHPEGRIVSAGAPIHRSRTIVFSSSSSRDGQVPAPPPIEDTTARTTLRLFHIQGDHLPIKDRITVVGFDPALFRFFASEYRLTGASVADLVTHNCWVAKQCDQPVAEHCWAILLLLFNLKPSEEAFKNADCAVATLNPSVLNSFGNSEVLGGRWKELFRKYLDFCIERGDVQTCATIAVVVGTARLADETGVSSKRILQWCVEYRELLQRLQMFNVANLLVAAANLQYLNEAAQTGTTVRTLCKCGKPPGDTSGVYCEHCSNPTGICEICHLPVKGVYVWCQGCGHGGHLEHMMEWFKDEVVCPSGCNHRCTLHPMRPS